MKLLLKIFQLVWLFFPFYYFGQTSVTLTSGTTWYVPFGVTSITVECWGGGGGSGGGTNTSGPGGSGGGGGAYAKSIISVTGGQSYSYSIGAGGAASSSGGNTTFNTTSVIAVGGGGGVADGGTVGAGGLASSSTGTTKYSGGDGYIGAGTVGGGGGGSAGTAGNGNTATSQTGATAVTGGGAGADGQALGANGATPGAGYGGGAGGSGRRSGGSESGASGYQGKIIITYTPAATTYTVGPTGDFASITAVKTALGNSSVLAPVIFELQTTYTDASETYPLTFTSVTGASSTNTITFRPTSGASNLVCDYAAASSTTMINFNGADYFIFDGRPGGVGTTVSDIQWTIRNTRTAATVGSTIELYNDATYNQFNYLNIEGECGIVATIGIVYINSGTTTGNDYNQFNYCKIQDLTTGGTTAFPFGGICINGTSAAISDDFITIDNCQIINISTPTSTSTNYIVGYDVSNLTITNNHMFHNSGTSLPTAVTGYFFAFIFIDNGTGHTITGNYMGGTASSCGGSALTYTGASNIRGIHLQSLTSATTTTVSNNYFSNFAITSTMNVSAGNAYLVAYRLYGACNITCSGNTIGSLTSNGNITITHNNASAAGGILAIWDGSSATTTISNNNIGGITINSGTSTITLNALIHIYSGSATGTVSVTGNTIGGDSGVGGQISVADDIFFRGIYSERTTTTSITNNTIQNISHTGDGSLITIFNNVGPLTCTGNIIKDITTGASNTKVHYLIANGGNVATNKYNPAAGTLANSPTISSNEISNITCSNTSTTGQLNGIYINASGTITCNSNIMGSTTANNVSVANDNQTSVIWFTGNGTITCNSNTIQQWNITNTGSSTSISGIWVADGTLSSCDLNDIKNLTIAGGTISSCIGVSTADATSVTNNTISSISLTGTGTSASLYGIYLSSSNTITCSNNTVGSTTNNNISLAGNSLNVGIYFTGTSTSITCSSNTIQEFDLTNTGASSIFSGIYATTGLLNATSNTIQNIDNAGTGSATTILYGIHCATASASNSIISNTISDLNSTTTSAVAPYVRGISLQTGGGNIKKNMVKALTSSATNSPILYGIRMISGSWNLHNNIILISNGSNTQPTTINGISDETTGTNVVYHNTVKIYGSVASGTDVTRAYRRNAGGTHTVKNNIFQNIRTGTGTHYAYSASNVTGLTTNNNYLEVTDDANYLGYWSATAYNFADWKTNSGETNSLSGTETINTSTGKAATTFIGANAGVDLFTGSTVIDDKDGIARDVTPWMGAFEGGVALPIELMTFEGVNKNIFNELRWKTASENNNDYFTVEKSTDGEDFNLVQTVEGAGNSTTVNQYMIMDYDFVYGINYYRLKQTDFDGKETLSNIIAINNVNNSNKEVINIINLTGQTVKEDYKGVVFIMYSDGTSLKTIQ